MPWGPLCERENEHVEQKLQRERAKRESELYKMVEQAAIDERQEHEERSLRTCQSNFKKKEEEEEALGLTDEMQRNLDEAQARASQTERTLGPGRGIHTLL